MKPIVTLLAAVICFCFIAGASPTASFTASVTSGCSPLNVQFTNTSTGAVSYYWDLGNGNTSTLTNPGNLFTSVGNFTITLVATDANGLKDTARYVNYINVVAQPTAGFYATSLASCLDGNSFSFVNTSVGANSYLWDFGDGILSTQQNPVHSYSLSGIFTVTLIAKNIYGCSDQTIRNQYITIYPKPKADIVVDAYSTCDTSKVFHFSTSSAAVSYRWNFGDGTTSNLAAPGHTFSPGKVFNVSLIVTDSRGCSDTSTTPATITIEAANWANCIAGSPGGCVPWATTFYSQSFNMASCIWDFGDGTTSTQPNVYHGYTIPGSYTITYIAISNSGCKDTVVKKNMVIVGAVPIVNFTFTSAGGCVPAAVQFNNLSTNYDSCLWTFGDGSTSTAVNPLHVYSNSGNYTVTLKCSSPGGCTQSKTVQNSLSVSFIKSLFSASPRLGCPPLTVNFANFSLGTQLSYFWDFGDGSTSTQPVPTHTYTSSGSFDVKLIVRNAAGCVDTMLKQSYVQTVNPVANYVPPPPTKGCAPLTAQFTDGSMGSTAWLWNFGDGVTSTLQNPVHTYTNPGTYIVALTTTTAGGGCSQIISNFSTFIVCGGNVGFTHTESKCPPYISTFTDTSSNAVAWLWTFDDGATSTAQNPTHTFAVPGYHSVSLAITTACGCTYSIMQSNGVYFTPFGANFYGIPNGTTFPTTFDFHANSTGATAWFWDFGDGGTSTLENPSHYYAAAGNYTVTLIITNGLCTTTYKVPAISFGTPDSSAIPSGNPGIIEPQSGCTPLAINFSQTFRGAVSWHWDFGDGDSSLLEFPLHTFTKAGIYTVILTTYDTLNLPSVLKMDSLVRVSGPKAHFTFSQLPNCQNTQIILTDSSKDISQWHWDFGDSSSTTSGTWPQIQNHLYKSGMANYIISLTVSDTAGCSDAVSTSIFSNITSPMIASETEICGLDTVHFSTSLQNYTSYFWNFGDSSTSSLSNPSHVYLSQGSYPVSLTVTDKSGCSQTFNLHPNVAVNMPVANFQVSGPAQGCNFLNAEFINLSANADGYLWDFGDGNTTTTKDPNHYYASAGIYDVTLTAYRGNCISVFKIPKAIEVDAIKANGSNLILGICLPFTVIYKDLSINASSWHWDFGDGTSSTLQNPVHIYSSTIYQYPLLTVTNATGCRDSVYFNPPPAMQAQFSFSTDSGCIPLTVTFTNRTFSAASYFWDFGDGTTSTITSPVHTYSVPGNYTVMLVTDAGPAFGHCTDTIIKPFIIHVKQPVARFTADNLHACAPALINFIDSSADADRYLWDFGDGTTSTDAHPSHIYNKPGIFTVSLHVYSNVGCSDSLTIPQYITILGPITNFTATATEGCQPFTVNFADQSINAIDWSWNFGDGATITANSKPQNPSHLYTDTGTFTATLVTHDTAGCFSYYEYPLKVIVHPQAIADLSTSDTLGCSPMIANFTNASRGYGPGVTGLYWDFGDGTTSTDTSAAFTHSYTSGGTYHVSLIATNSSGCNDTAYFPTPIQVLTGPQVAFSTSALQGCSPLYISFTSNVTGTQGANYFWDFGNGDTSTATNPVIFWSSAGSYLISLTVTNNNGCSQTITKPSFIQPLDSLPPSVTPILSVSVLSNTSVEIQWANNAAIDLGGYILYRLNNFNGLYDPIYNDTDVANTNFTLNPTYTDTGLNTLRYVYTYKLLTYDICKNVIPLDSLKAASTINVSSANDSSGIFVQWNAYGGCPVSSYQVYRCVPGKSKGWNYLATVPPDTLQYLDTTVNCPHEYSYRITATDLCGNTYTSNSDTSVTVPPNIFANQIVDAVRATVENNSFVLSEWKQPTVHPEKVVQFDIYRSTDNKNFSYVASVPSYQTDYMDYNVDVQSEHYYYKILVINTCDVSEDLSGTTSTILLKGEMEEARRVHLHWTPYEKWDTGVDYFIIEKRDDAGNWQIIKKTDGTSLQYDYQE